MIGDLNVDHLKWQNPDYDVADMVNLLKDKIETENFEQYITKPTHFWTGTSSLIDHIWSNCPDKILSMKNLDRAASDHNVVLVKIRTKGKDNNTGEVLARDKRNFVQSDFKNEVARIDWTELYRQQDINLAYNIFAENFTEILNKMAPLKKTQIRNKITPWVTTKTTELMKKRDEARNKAVTTQNQDDWTTYRKLRNTCTAEVKRDKTNYHKKQFEDLEKVNDVKNLYSKLKNNMGWKKTGPPTAFRVEGRIERKQMNIANIQNDYTILTKSKN